MILVRFYSADGQGTVLAGFRVSGHTGVRGESIVCAAVSSACYMAANTITEVLHIDADISLRDGDMSLRTAESDRAGAQVILQGLRIHLQQLAEQYPDHIQIHFSEVQQSC